MPVCKKGHYKNNLMLSRNPLICVGGRNALPCPHLENCHESLWHDFKNWCRDHHFKPLKINFCAYFAAKIKEEFTEKEIDNVTK